MIAEIARRCFPEIVRAAAVSRCEELSAYREPFVGQRFLITVADDEQPFSVRLTAHAVPGDAARTVFSPHRCEPVSLLAGGTATAYGTWVIQLSDRIDGQLDKPVTWHAIRRALCRELAYILAKRREISSGSEVAHEALRIGHRSTVLSARDRALVAELGHLATREQRDEIAAIVDHAGLRDDADGSAARRELVSAVASGETQAILAELCRPVTGLAEPDREHLSNVRRLAQQDLEHHIARAFHERLAFPVPTVGDCAFGMAHAHEHAPAVEEFARRANESRIARAPVTRSRRWRSPMIGGGAALAARRPDQRGMLGGEGPAESTMASIPTQALAPLARSFPVNQDLLRGICKWPDVDELRRDYVRWLESQGYEDTAELIRLQLDRFQDDSSRRRYHSRPGPREQQLLAREVHVSEIARYAVVRRSVSVDRGYELHRGFVEFVRVRAQVLVDEAARIFAAAPIQHVEILPSSGVSLDRILAVEELGRLRTLSLPRWKLGDDDAEKLSEKFSSWNHLLGLELVGNRIGTNGVRCLAERSPAWLLAVDLTGNPCDPRDVPSYDDNREVCFEPTQIGRKLEEDYGLIRWLHPGDLYHADRYHLMMLVTPQSQSFEYIDDRSAGLLRAGLPVVEPNRTLDSWLIAPMTKDD